MSMFCSCISTGSWSFRAVVHSGRNGNGRIAVERIDFLAKRRQFFQHVQRLLSTTEDCHQLRASPCCKTVLGRGGPSEFCSSCTCYPEIKPFRYFRAQLKKEKAGALACNAAHPDADIQDGVCKNSKVHVNSNCM